MTTTSDPNTTVASPSNTIAGDTRTHHGSLRSKLVLSLAGVFFVFLMIDEVVRKQVIGPEFMALERSGAIRDANRVLGAINSEVEHLCELGHQWASHLHETDGDCPWKPSQGHSQADSCQFRGMSWVASLRQDGVWSWLHHPPDDTATAQRQLSHLVELCRSGRSEPCGMTRIGDNALVAFAVFEVDTTAAKEHLVICRTIDEAMVSSLRRRTQVDFILQPPRTADESKRFVVWEADEATLAVDVQLTGVMDQRLANVHVRVPRDIAARSRRTTTLARNTFIFGSVVVLLMLLLLLQRIVIGPLTAIRQHSDRVAEEGLSIAPLEMSSNDEIGHLARTFENMFQRLSSTQTQLSRASQAAGRSQVASTVIHNVGNVLTNVNSLIDDATGRVQGLRIGSLDKLADRLKHAGPDDGLLEATPDYLEGLAGSLKSDQESLEQLLDTLNDNVRHIHDVIRDQQRHTDHDIKPTTVRLNHVIHEAISCCRSRLDQDSVAVNVTVPPSVEVYSDRTLLLQTVINVIGNARHAMRDVQHNRQLDIQLSEGTESVSIRMTDNGCGMSQDTIQRVFDAHFTTREGGTGLGLHFCANTLKRLGGRIRAFSDGPGHGSTFEIELPVIPTAGRNQPSHHWSITTALAESDA